MLVLVFDGGGQRGKEEVHGANGSVHAEFGKNNRPSFSGVCFCTAIFFVSFALVIVR